MTYLACLDEFGHIGPYVSKEDPKYHDSPVFGFAGFVLPAEEAIGLPLFAFAHIIHDLQGVQNMKRNANGKKRFEVSESGA